MRRHTGRNRNIRPPCITQHSVHQLRPRLGVPERSSDPENPHFGRLQRQRHCKRVIHIVPNVGINNDFFGSHRRWLRTTQASPENQSPCHQNKSSHAVSLHTPTCAFPPQPSILSIPL